MDADAGGACPADEARPGAAVRAAGADGAGRRAPAERAERIEAYWSRARGLRRQVQRFIEWLRGPGRAASRRGAASVLVAALRFNAVLSQFDLFTDVITQRSEHETGVWLSGLDVARRRADAARRPGSRPAGDLLPGSRTGAAIRRARTRLPGGGENPVAIVRVPRERMVGSGIALVAGPRGGPSGGGAARIWCVAAPDRCEACRRQRRQRARRVACWRALGLGDRRRLLASVARVGIGSTLGLIGVVSLPRAFVFGSTSTTRIRARGSGCS